MSSCHTSNLTNCSCSSSSPSFHPATRNRGGSPASNWTLSPSMAAQDQKKKEKHVSARKLAATLWEFNDFEPSRTSKKKKKKKEILEGDEPFRRRSREKSVTVCRSGLSLQQHLSDPSFTPFSPKVGSQPINKKKNCGKCAIGFENRLKEARSSVSASKRLLEALDQTCIQEQNSSSMPLILAMRSELDRARNQIDRLIRHHQGSNKNDIERLTQHFAEERKSWKRRERERIRGAIAIISEDLEVEKKLRRQAERLNKKIAKEMAGAKASKSKFSKDLEREKRAKEILQQVCDELAKGIGEDRAEVEKLKKESAKIREEVEREREMLQLADVLREERVQMKLSEAKYQFEEKNSVLEKMRNELESILRTKDEEKRDLNPELKKLEDLESYLSTECWKFQNPVKVEHDDDDDSDESDLQSIELNMDDDNRSYKWSYACENAANRDELKRVSIEKDIGRKSFSERIEWGSISFNKGNANFKKREFGGMNVLESSDQRGDPERAVEFLSRPSMSLRECLSWASPDQKVGKPLALQYIDGEDEEYLKKYAAGRKSEC